VALRASQSWAKLDRWLPDAFEAMVFSKVQRHPILAQRGGSVDCRVELARFWFNRKIGWSGAERRALAMRAIKCLKGIWWMPWR
jgi:hypothetical protein